MKYVIIGNGVASIGAVDGVRRVDKDGEILVIGEESVLTYGRPLISYFLAGKIDLDRLALRSEKFYVDNKVRTMLSTRVTAVDTAKKEVVTDSGERIGYDRLLLATGGAPFYPPMTGLDGPDVYAFTTLAHALALDQAAKKLKKVVVVGGGLIGLKAAESLHDRGVSVSVVELAPRPLSAAFDDSAGRLVSDRLNEVGIKMFCGLSVTGIRRGEDGHVKGVTLSDGRFLDCQAVIVAVGVAPNAKLAKDAGITVDRGVMVDDHLQTSAQGVYAAGDVAQAKDMLTDENRVTPIWPNAYNQGFYAGKNMAGADEPYPGGLPMNSIGFYGLPTASTGIVNPPVGEAGFEVRTLLEEDKGVYRKLVFKDGALVGFVLVGDIDLSGVYAGFVRFKLPITDELKNQLIEGRASALLWPEEFFEQTWNPATPCETPSKTAPTA